MLTKSTAIYMQYMHTKPTTAVSRYSFVKGEKLNSSAWKRHTKLHAKFFCPMNIGNQDSYSISSFLLVTDLFYLIVKWVKQLQMQSSQQLFSSNLVPPPNQIWAVQGQWPYLNCPFLRQTTVSLLLAINLTEKLKSIRAFAKHITRKKKKNFSREKKHRLNRSQQQ